MVVHSTWRAGGLPRRSLGEDGPRQPLHDLAMRWGPTTLRHGCSGLDDRVHLGIAGIELPLVVFEVELANAIPEHPDLRWHSDGSEKSVRRWGRFNADSSVTSYSGATRGLDPPRRPGSRSNAETQIRHAACLRVLLMATAPALPHLAKCGSAGCTAFHPTVPSRFRGESHPPH